MRQGRFEQARGGTLFLDEIGDMPLAIQTRLLRVLADGSFYRVGGQQLQQADVRIIAATHQDLMRKVEQGSFREDLYHRLNVVHLEIPALAARREDVQLLAQHFLQRCAQELEEPAKQLSPEALFLLQNHPWPGNVRQLENLCRWLTVMVGHQLINDTDLPGEFQNHHSDATPNQPWQELFEQWASQQLASGVGVDVTGLELKLESILTRLALEKCAGHKQNAAKLLGWGRNTLTRKLQQFSVECPELQPYLENSAKEPKAHPGSPISTEGTSS